MGKKEFDLRGEVNLYGRLAGCFLIGPILNILHRSLELDRCHQLG
jgi:hypothetical protein